eukprot:CAMPEP_0119312772 /NCGR_PEP_ID=MMETSP1333-20130426/27003_1 /TAXON_ID=418940 /ORGANISM="Scyphosphaera apsteinii, Strain RCC1455" /LENGTH=233 /DNA_ID=CAMNT_0007317437 /DNA_START=14 /DNA_END=716 /DNA_ORIENTATION=+
MSFGGGLEPTYEMPESHLEPLSSSSAVQQMLSQDMLPRRPPQRMVILFHGLFKALAILVYVLSGFLFSGSYVLTFVVVTILSAVDFWTVKNVSGRLLVGMRWWNFIDENGESQWRFESFEEQRFVHPTDSNTFWLVLFVTPVVWLLLAVGALFTLRFMWLLLIVVALTCNMINVVGYAKCKKDARKKLKTLGGNVLSRGMEMGGIIWGEEDRGGVVDRLADEAGRDAEGKLDV